MINTNSKYIHDDDGDDDDGPQSFIAPVGEVYSTNSSNNNTDTITKTSMYVGVLLLTIVIICISTETSTIIRIVFQQHEPSIRIFRCLCEFIVLLFCTALSIQIYIQYLSCHMTQQLLFESIDVNKNDTDHANNDDPDNGDTTRRYTNHRDARHYENELFARVNDTDDDDEDDDTNKDNDPEEHVGDETRTDKEPPSNLVNDHSNNNNKNFVDVTSTNNELRQIPTKIISIALEVSLYTSITFLLYLLSAIQATTTTASAGSSMSSDRVEDIPTTTTTTGTSRIPFLGTITHATLQIVAPTFPLLLFVWCGIRCIQHYTKYKELYTVLSYTMYAPWYNVTFRDGMIGDILTSMVRPMQDVAFTICYLLFGLRGYWSDHYFNDTSIPTTDPTSSMMTLMSNTTASFGSSFVASADSYVPSMERSWIVHTAILPACMISPLWWRFLQTVRQSFDCEQRWPYLGNSFKYFLAAQVAMLGVYHPSVRQSSIWICSFVLATLYQIYWDVFMDWGLLVRDKKTSLWRLRQQRLYPWRSFYWMVLIINTLLRFCWTLSFVPFHYLSASGVLTNNFSSEAWANVLVPTIASAEIIRRTLWGLIRVEWEAIKVKGEESGGLDDHEVEMTPMKMQDDSTTDTWNSSIHGSSNRYKLPFTSDMSSMNKVQIFGELCLYTTTFAVLGLIIAAHRGTL